MFSPSILYGRDEGADAKGPALGDGFQVTVYLGHPASDTLVFHGRLGCVPRIDEHIKMNPTRFVVRDVTLDLSGQSPLYIVLVAAG